MENKEQARSACTNRREFELAKEKLFSELEKGTQARREQGSITLKQIKEKMSAKL